MVKNRITVNNVTVEVEEGSHVVVRNGVLFVNGEAIQSQLSGDVHVHWHGDLASLEVDGSVSCRDVEGDLTAGGSVQCRNVEGTVSAGGSVHARGVTAASAVGFSGDIKVTAGGGSGSGASVKIGHGAIKTGDIHAGVHARGRRSGNVYAGGSVHLDD